MAGRRRILLAEFEPLIPALIEYSTWNPKDKDSSVSLSGGNLHASKTVAHATQWGTVAATLPFLAGVSYWETTVLFSGSANIALGITGEFTPLMEPPGGNMEVPLGSVGVWRDGGVRVKGNIVGSVGAFVSGDVIRHWFDRDALTYKVARGAGPWVSVTGIPMMDPLTYPFRPHPAAAFLTPSGTTASCTANFGQGAFAYPVPDGAQAGVFSTSAPTRTTVYLSNTKFNTEAGEVPASTEYLARIVGDQDIESVREASCFVLGGQTRAGRAQVIAVNADGRLDAWKDYLWRDAPFRLYRGTAGMARGDFELWQRGKVETAGVAPNKGRFAITLADPLAALDRPSLPEAFPSDQANAQVAGQPRSMVLGSPLYCEGNLLSTAVTGVDAFRYELDYIGLDGINEVHDRGDRFSGPADPYVANTAISLANGGAFTTWAPDGAGIQMPQNFARVTAFGATTDRFQQGGVAGTLRMLSGGQAWTAIYHTVSSVLTGYRYTIAFTVTASTKPGQIIFRADGPTPNRPHDDVVVAITGTGAYSVTLDVTESAQLQVVLGRTELDVTIDNLTVSSIQVVDWTIPDAKGFKLANKPDGRVTANPRGTRAPTAVWTEGFSSWTAGMPTGWSLVGSTNRTGLAIVRNGSANSVIFQHTAPAGDTRWIGMRSDGKPLLQAGRRYSVAITCSSLTSGPLYLMLDGSDRMLGQLNSTGTSTFQFVADVTGAVLLRSGLGTPMNALVTAVVVQLLTVPETLPEIIRELLVNRASIPAADIDWASLLAVDDGANASTRLASFQRGQSTYLRLVREIMDSFCGWCVPNRLGQLSFGAMREPSWTPILFLDKTNIAGPPAPTVDLAPGLTTTLAGARNHSPFGSDSDIATSVDPATRALLTAEYTVIRTAAAALIEAGLTPVSQVLSQAINAAAKGTWLQQPDAIQTMVNRIATLWRPTRTLWQVTALLTATQADALEPGQTLRLTYPRFGLDTGRNLLVLGVRSGFFGRRVKLTLWG